uniref:ANF_receptor domain-containing protein n=1 Tax=Macrostomum lignano TaxID=282301 RepID=A0A1I8J250_9PLAT
NVKINFRKYCLEMSSIISIIVCSLLFGSTRALDLKIGVITEAGSLNGSLIDVAFARRVNYNWRVLQGHTLSYVHVNVSSCSSHQAVRTVCSESGLSGLIGVGSCSLLDEVSSLSKSLQLPLIALPTGLCDSARLSKDMTIVGSHSSENIVAAAATVLTSDSIVSSVAVFFDGLQSTTVLQNLQSSLSSAGVSSLTFRVDDSVNASVTPDLVHHLKRLVKKKVFKLLLFASPRNALSVLRLAREAAVMQQNYFWLVLDTGLSKADVLSVTPANANVALLRGSVFTECTAAVMDVFPQCQTDWLRPYVESGSNLETLMLEAKSGIYKQIAERMVIINEVCTTTWKPDQACLGDYTPRLASAMRNCSLSLLFGSSALDFKIGVITEAGNLNSSLIDVAFARRVNYNWRVLQGHTLSYVHVNVSSCSSHQAVRTVCSESGLSGLIGVGSCSLLDEVSSLSKSLQLPLIALPTGLCDSARLSKDAVEAMAKALNDSLLDPGFSPGNASCAPLRHWTSGSTVFNRLMSISDYDTQRGLISFNSSTRHFSSQRVE